MVLGCRDIAHGVTDFTRNKTLAPFEKISSYLMYKYLFQACAVLLLCNVGERIGEGLFLF